MVPWCPDCGTSRWQQRPAGPEPRIPVSLPSAGGSINDLREGTQRAIGLYDWGGKAAKERPGAQSKLLSRRSAGETYRWQRNNGTTQVFRIGHLKGGWRRYEGWWKAPGPSQNTKLKGHWNKSASENHCFSRVKSKVLPLICLNASQNIWSSCKIRKGKNISALCFFLNAIFCLHVASKYTALSR